MKSFTLTVIFLFFLTAVKPQVSIMQSDMPDVDDTFRISSADLLQLDTTLLKLDSTGANYYWDYSWLVRDNQRVDTFYSPWFLNLVYNYYFTNPFDQDHFSTYALHVPDMDFGGGMYQFQLTDVYDFYRETSGGYYNVGFGAKINGIPQGFPYDPTDEIYDFVVEYGNTTTSYSYWEAEAPSGMFGIDFTYGRKMTRKNYADGWGMLITPADTFNVLRIKSVMEITDTVYNDSIGFGYGFDRPDLIHYKWLSKNSGVPVLLVEAEDAMLGPAVNRIEYYDPWINPIGFDEIAAQENGRLILYPNPASGKTIFVKNTLGILAGDDLQYEIHDFTGKTVSAGKVTCHLTNTFVVDCQALGAGIYSVAITDNQHNYGRGKLVVPGK
ncbi:MAG: T9SS type A sorting domain-containing protein [Bacteroidetes bacterium]|nr:T9SS type A sorting domain-containing protein [Bacteroidota bacterium]